MNQQILDIFELAKNHPKRNQYVAYMDSITPHTPEEIFWRFVFAFMSIHSTYRSNLRGYQMLRNPGAWKNRECLLAALRASGCGMHNQRTKFLWKFREEFFGGRFNEVLTEPGLQAKRNKLCDKLYGIGMAKISFALEMSFPRQDQVVCMDVHQLRLYGKDENASKNKNDYMECENDWCERSRKIGLPPFAVRNIFWDNLKGQRAMRFWSYVFEPHGDQIPVDAADGIDFEQTLEALKT